MQLKAIGAIVGYAAEAVPVSCQAKRQIRQCLYNFGSILKYFDSASLARIVEQTFIFIRHGNLSLAEAESYHLWELQLAINDSWAQSTELLMQDKGTTSFIANLKKYHREKVLACLGFRHEIDRLVTKAVARAQSRQKEFRRIIAPVFGGNEGDKP